MKIYAFFLYVSKKFYTSYLLINRYRTSDPRVMVGDTERYLYAYTDKKSYRDVFMKERNMKLFGYHPTTITFQTEEQFDIFDKLFMGRELEWRGIEDFKFTVHGDRKILGTSDEFSYSQYDYPETLIDILCPTAESEIPFAEMFRQKYRLSLVDLEYPFQCKYDVYDDYLWDTINSRLILDEYGVFIKYFSNLFRDPKKKEGAL